MSQKALLVGINDFPNPDWQLNGCLNDVDEMQKILETYYQFKPDDIKPLKDQAATNQGIRAGLAWLLEGSQPGDVRVFHFSSHGTQVDDIDGDEPDCIDEVIVPYDHDWDHPFRDDDLRAIFTKIPPGVNFTFIADCCHSGGIQKALLENPKIHSKPRFLTPPLEIRERIAAKLTKRGTDYDAQKADELSEVLAGAPPAQWPKLIKEYTRRLRARLGQNNYAMVPFDRDVLLAACEDRQTAADAEINGKYHGAFTWGLTQAIHEAHGNLTYESLIKHTAAKIKVYEQKPQLECPVSLRKRKLFAPLS